MVAIQLYYSNIALIYPVKNCNLEFSGNSQETLSGIIQAFVRQFIQEIFRFVSNFLRDENHFLRKSVQKHSGNNLATFGIIPERFVVIS